MRYKPSSVFFFLILTQNYSSTFMCLLTASAHELVYTILYVFCYVNGLITFPYMTIIITFGHIHTLSLFLAHSAPSSAPPTLLGLSHHGFPSISDIAHSLKKNSRRKSLCGLMAQGYSPSWPGNQITRN